LATSNADSLEFVVMVFSILGFELWLAPSDAARGDTYMTSRMVRCNINVASRYHGLVISTEVKR
jgi:hypothetical protein